MKSLRGIKVLNENDMKSVTGAAANIQFLTKIMHFVVIYKVKINTIIIADPAKGLQELSFKNFSNYFTNKVLLIYQ